MFCLLIEGIKVSRDRLNWVCMLILGDLDVGIILFIIVYILKRCKESVFFFVVL